MDDKFEGLVKVVYQRWQKHAMPEGDHLSEEIMACFADGRLSAEESEPIMAHLAVCEACAENLALSLSAESAELKDLPVELLDKVREILSLKGKSLSLEIFLRLKENILEIINVSGDILLGQELVPASILRGRNIKEFKDEVTILKDFKDIRLEVRVENKQEKYFNLTLKAKQKISLRPFKDLRITLIKEGVELESYLSDFGSVIFEHVLLGKYSLEVSGVSGKLASVVLDIRA
ncbi:MAG: zf-HC2 domain-containing protein [Candidatus Omnitrophota bacterium]|nr:zf-HC2 domain-containing protein [Candidatus Omnitrophota bacterium]